MCPISVVFQKFRFGIGRKTYTNLFNCVSFFFCKNIGNIATTKCVMMKNYLRIKIKINVYIV